MIDDNQTWRTYIVNFLHFYSHTQELFYRIFICLHFLNAEVWEIEFNSAKLYWFADLTQFWV